MAIIMEIATMLTTRSQRWRERRARYVDDLTVIDPSDFAVDQLDPSPARQFVAAHHYLPNYPAAQVAVGLFGKQAALVGIAVFATPSTASVITRHTGFADPARGTTLARFFLLSEIPGNGETWFLSRALRLLRRERPGIEAVVSYSDPQAGHIGQCYAALSGAFRGMTPPRTAYRIAGTPISGRSLSKIRLGERGAAGAIDQLVRLGAPRPNIQEAPDIWLARLRRDRILVAERTLGLFAYSFELTPAARRQGRALPRKPYPKQLPRAHPQFPFMLAR
ncbi:hypothetical protein [Sphingomonas pollutisoli]|uniref:Mom family adenine methylcarbamoylation protein n=1 Tax=Sphingomonas pollutisoli TaxID=3030829 RepID=UPI0030B862D1